MSDLETLQRWLTSIIVRPGALHDKILAADATYNLHTDDVIRSSHTLSSHDRIHIYARGYILRLMECMRAEYPVLRNLLGEELFGTFAQAYLAHIPSHSYSLFDLGTHFPDFLQASQPKNDGQTTEERQQFALPVQIARVERAKTEVYRSKGTENNAPIPAHELSAFFLLEADTLGVPPCLRLLELDFPLIAFIKAVEKGEQPPVPSPQQTWLVISRQNYGINMREVEAWQWYFLKALEQTNNYTQAIATSATASNTPKDTIFANLMLWIPVAVNLGFLYRNSQ